MLYLICKQILDSNFVYRKISRTTCRVKTYHVWYICFKLYIIMYKSMQSMNKLIQVFKVLTSLFSSLDPPPPLSSSYPSSSFPFSSLLSSSSSSSSSSSDEDDEDDEHDDETLCRTDYIALNTICISTIGYVYTVYRDIFAPVLFSPLFAIVVSGRIKDWANTNVPRYIFSIQSCLCKLEQKRRSETGHLQV